MAGINRDFFFQYARGVLFSSSLKQSQVNGLNALLDFWEGKYAKKDDRWLAYCLATAHHETGASMQPIGEYGGKEYKRQLYDVTGNDPARAKKMGNTEPGDGVLYAGRGYVQLTWKSNYARAGKAVGRDLVAKPDDAMIADVSAAIMYEGMIAGWFTGKKLADYFEGATSDWLNARRIINGKDKAELIQGYALHYYASVSYTV